MAGHGNRQKGVDSGDTKTAMADPWWNRPLNPRLQSISVSACLAKFRFPQFEFFFRHPVKFYRNVFLINVVVYGSHF